MDLPSFIRYVEPIDIGEPPTHYLNIKDVNRREIAINNFNINRQLKLTGKQYLTIAIGFNSLENYYDYTEGFFFNTCDNKEIPNGSYYTSAVLIDVVSKENLMEKVTKFIAEFLNNEDEDEDEEIDYNIVHLQQIYSEEPYFCYSGPIDWNWEYLVEDKGESYKLTLREIGCACDTKSIFGDGIQIPKGI